MQLQNTDIDIEDDSFDLKKELTYYLYYWPWFLLSVILFITGGIAYIGYSTNVYETTAIIQIDEDTNDPASLLTQGLGINLTQSGYVPIEKDIAIIRSNRILKQVVKDMDLQTTITKKGIVKDEMIWGEQIPFKIEFSEDFNLRNIENIELNIAKNQGQLSYEDLKKNIQVKDKIEFGETYIGDNFTIIIPNNEIVEDGQYYIRRETKLKVIEVLKSAFNVNVNEAFGKTITMKLQGINRIKNETVLNELIKKLEEDQKSDKRLVFKSTIKFIDERLEVLSISLDTMQKKSIEYRSENKIFSTELQTGNALTNIMKGEDEAFELEMQLTLVNSLKEDLVEKEAFTLLPVNVGIENSNINTLVSQYNTLVMERDALLSNSTEKNPLVRQLSVQLERFKTNILVNISTYIQGISTSLDRYAQLKNSKEREVSSLPTKESQLLNFARNFQITEGLYLFLLQRREEAAISYESTISDVKVVDYAYSSVEPISPKNNLIILGAIFFGIILPFGILFTTKLLDTKIHSREDLEAKTSLPIIGELPKIKDLDSIKNPRSLIAEATRMLRTNLSFVIPPDIVKPVIISTSATKGDGKTFITFNLACSLSASGSKVLVIGADLRNPQLHKLLKISPNQNGLSNYLVDKEITSIDDMIFEYEFSDNKFNILLSGPIPPNPSELLISSRFKLLLDTEKESYDYILIDSAPMMLVSDTGGILEHADVVIYNVRANKSDQSEIGYTQKIKENNKIKNLALVLNGVKKGPKSGYNYGYGYGYGNEI